MSKQRLLVLGGPAHQIRFIERAKELGLYIGLVDMNPEAPARSHADEFFQCSLMDKEGVLKIALGFKPDGVTQGMVDRSIITCAYVAECLGLPGVGISSATKASDKYAMIKAFENHQVPSPLYDYVAPTNLEAAIETKLPYPLIVKPVDMQGSRGVFLAHNKGELKEMLVKSSSIGISGEVLIQELLQGPEFSIEFLVLKGVAKVMQVTGKIGYEPPYFVGTGVLQPARISAEERQAICDLIVKATKSVGLVNCVGNADVMLTADGPKMIEMAPRQGGCGVGEQLLELSTGVSFTDIAIKLALGEEVAMPENELERASCIKYLLSEKGTVKAIHGVEQAKEVPQVSEVNIIAKVGDFFNGPINKDARIIAVIASGADANEAESVCDKAIATISIDYE